MNEENEKCTWDGSEIKRLLKRDGKKMKELAVYIGVSRQSIDSWINGNIPRGDHFVSLCDFFRVGPNSFIKRNRNETSIGSIGFFN